MEQEQNSQNNRAEEVHIYLRNSQKKAHFIRVRKSLNVEDLRQVVSNKLRTSSEKLVMFLKGEQLQANQQVSLSEKNIVHVVNLDRVNR